MSYSRHKKHTRKKPQSDKPQPNKTPKIVDAFKELKKPTTQSIAANTYRGINIDKYMTVAKKFDPLFNQIKFPKISKATPYLHLDTIIDNLLEVTDFINDIRTAELNVDNIINTNTHHIDNSKSAITPHWAFNTLSYFAKIKTRSDLIPGMIGNMLTKQLIESPKKILATTCYNSKLDGRHFFQKSSLCATEVNGKIYTVIIREQYEHNSPLIGISLSLLSEGNKKLNFELARYDIVGLLNPNMCNDLNLSVNNTIKSPNEISRYFKSNTSHTNYAYDFENKPQINTISVNDHLHKRENITELIYAAKSLWHFCYNEKTLLNECISFNATPIETSDIYLGDNNALKNDYASNGLVSCENIQKFVQTTFNISNFTMNEAFNSDVDTFRNETVKKESAKIELDYSFGDTFKVTPGRRFSLTELQKTIDNKTFEKIN